ncbi:hypothetical protein Hypma_012049 [Hypsizygus marmoreus]|uniref:F-box domain-containing protein n=1 Tax=Hypsizygus marmoreus TaxID=39966 RepID=A0A369JK26_HYPMA|nr:hypothetical protein Hypma_012049 [Hypsizygus marmoreus]
MHLPVELVQEIVIALTTPEYALQFGHTKDVLHALCQLCLADRTFFLISVPHLYSSIVVLTQRELELLLQTSPTLRSRSRALWLRYIPNTDTLVAELLFDMSQGLRRLALDIPGNVLDSSAAIRLALEHCAYLEDFTRTGYSPMQLFRPHPFWPDWNALRRLVLDGPLIDDAFIRTVSELPYLAHLAVIEPRWRYSADGTEVATFLCLLKASPSLVRLVLIYCEASQFYLSSLKRLRVGLTVDGLRQGPSISYLVIRGRVPGPMSQVRDQIGYGMIWDLDSKKLSGPQVLWPPTPKCLANNRS